MARFEVVIPYYQREAGLLIKALESIFSQGVDDVCVHVVDDGSPRPAALDLDMMSASQRARVNLIVQKNTGANGARNRGLSEIGDDAKYVAFLDSDDVWLPGHLDRAAAALDRPRADFFYDTVKMDDDLGSDNRPPDELIDAAHYVQVDGAPDLMEVAHPLRILCGEWYDHMHLSVTVLTAELARKVRFNHHFTIADDFEYFYQCARHSRFWLIDKRDGAERGSGANIWHGIKTSELRYSQEKYYSMLVLKRICSERDVDPTSREEARQRIRVFREQFFWAQRDRMAEGHRPSLDLWLKFIIQDLGFGPFVASQVFRKMRPVAS